ncbi:hypothetical protein [Streptomyces chryseus]
MRFPNFVSRTAKVAVLVIGILATAIMPAAAEDTVPPGPGTIAIAPNHAVREFRYCYNSTPKMVDLVITPGPDVITARYREEAGPAGQYGFGVDVINMSKTKSSWINFSYRCINPEDEIPVTIQKSWEPVTIAAGEDDAVVVVECPTTHPEYQSTEVNMDKLPAGSKPEILPFRKNGMLAGVSISVNNANGQAGELSGYITCKRFASS